MNREVIPIPTYQYECFLCDQDCEKIIPIKDRDDQTCQCGNKMHRKIVFNGVVYSATHNGGLK